MENFNFWFWDMTIGSITSWNRACWHVMFRLPSHAHAEALAAQLSRDSLDGLGTRVEVSDDKGVNAKENEVQKVEFIFQKSLRVAGKLTVKERRVWAYCCESCL